MDIALNDGREVERLTRGVGRLRGSTSFGTAHEASGLHGPDLGHARFVHDEMETEAYIQY
jgi:hypothetical protein